MESNNEENDKADWKIQLVMQNLFLIKILKILKPYIQQVNLQKFIRVVIQKMLLIHFLIQFQEEFNKQQKHQMKEEVSHESVALLYYYFQKVDIRRGESYIMSPNWIVSKKATINPKNEKDNECFKWSIISGLNYNKIKEKEFKKY